jgi:hypothetical protein
MTDTQNNKAWSEDMGEISGFGGGYEAVCRAMVLAGIAWVDAHPDADLKFSGYKNVYGVVTEESADAKALTAAMMDTPVVLNGAVIQQRAGEDCTGAMHHASVSHVLAYKRLGWDEYRRQLREHETADAKAEGAQ